MHKMVAVILLAIGISACESDNEHFCVRYQYLYQQLLEDDLPSYVEMKQQLHKELSDPGKSRDKTRFMLFVLEDWNAQIIPSGESARDFCLRIKRWQQYH